MEFLKMKRFRKSQKQKTDNDPILENNKPSSEELKAENSDEIPKATGDSMDPAEVTEDEDEDDDDDDFITEEVKRRLKELRKNSFMVIIPEESCLEEEGEEEEESSSCEWIEPEVDDGYAWCGFDAMYDKYCERMLFFDKMSSQQLQEAGSRSISNPSPKSATKKLALSLRNLSFKRKDSLPDDGELLQQEQQEEDNPYRNLETVYVAQVCLTWEALHCQYTQLSQKISSQQERSTCYGYAAQAFQQFQVLLQRFIENEPFEDGPRVETYVQTRNFLPKLLQVPFIQGLDLKGKQEDGSESPVPATDFLKVMEDAILTFHYFLKMDKKKPTGALQLFGLHNQTASALQLVQSSLDKKEIRLKELFKKKKSWKKKCWPITQEEVELLFGLIDIKLVSRVLRMANISKEQLLWCEEKMSKLDLSENRLHRNGCPVLFPC